MPGGHHSSTARRYLAESEMSWRLLAIDHMVICGAWLVGLAALPCAANGAIYWHLAWHAADAHNAEGYIVK